MVVSQIFQNHLDSLSDQQGFPKFWVGNIIHISVMTPPHLLHINIHFLKRLKKNIEMDNRMIFDRTR